MNQREMKDTIMEAEAEFQETMRKLEMDFVAPDAKSMKMLWMAMPKEARSFIQQNNPKGYAEVSKLMTGE